MRTRFKTGYTLIELLVVIAIIAILAAILFPVFAQAKAAAKKTRALSNAKQLSAAYQMYLNDYDDMTVSIAGNVGEWWAPLLPYVKSIGIICWDDRTRRETNAFRLSLGATTNSPFGYNWGPFGWRGGGLLEKQIFLDASVYGTSNVNVGKSATSIVDPANTFVYGHTYDTPRATVGIGFAADTYAGFSIKDTYYGGAWAFGFLDGHAKVVHMRGGILPGAFGGRFILPKSAGYYGSYCSDPDAIIQPEDGSTSKLNTSPLPPALACKDYATWVNQTITTPCAGNSTASACYWSN